MKKALRVFVVPIIVLSVMIITACSSNDSYTMTFDTLTDSQIEPIKANAGDAIFAPDAPEREGYRFDGWMYKDELFLFGVMPNEDIELTAKWSQYYDVSFDSDGGTDIQPLRVAEGDEIIFSDVPQKSHFKFLGWSYMGSIVESMVMPSEHLTLTAIWAPASTISFEITIFDRYLGDYVTLEIDDIVEVAGEPIKAPTPPEYAEYKFIAWKLDDEIFEFETMPNHDLTLTAEFIQLSNLPVLFIDLYNQEGLEIPIENITRETYVTSKISLENTDETHMFYDVDAVFKGRGNGSWVDSGDKKGYRIKFDSSQSVLGNPSSRHWVILANANFDDITMYRNKLAFNMADALFTNIDYATSAEWVDVYFNGNYHGVYLIAEHLRVDDDRVNIESEFGVIDTGYLVEYDSYAHGIEGVDYFRVQGLRHPFSMKSPNPDDYLEEGLTIEQYKDQVEFIQELVSEMASAALAKDFEGFSEVADVNSFVDIYILHELFKNIDTGFSSFFIYRHPGGKLFAGPPWDFDATAGSSPSRGNGSPSGIYVGLSVQAFSSRTANEMLISLYDTPAYKSVVVDRWKILSPDIYTFVQQTLSDQMIETYRFAIGRNFVRWPSPQGYGPPTSQETAENNWAANIATLRQWMSDRIAWLNGEWV